MYPWPSSETPESLSVCCEPGKTGFELLADAHHAVEDAVGKFLLAQFIPHILLRIELGR